MDFGHLSWSCYLSQSDLAVWVLLLYSMLSNNLPLSDELGNRAIVLADTLKTGQGWSIVARPSRRRVSMPRRRECRRPGPGPGRRRARREWIKWREDAVVTAAVVSGFRGPGRVVGV